MTRPFEAPTNELRVRWDCQDIAARLRIDAAAAYDENGQLTGWIALDPVALQEALDDYCDHYDEHPDNGPCIGCAEEGAE